MPSIIKKIINKTSDILSAPARAKAQLVKEKADQVVRDIKTVRAAKNIDLSDKNYKDPIFRARANVSNYENDYAKKMSGKSTRY